MGKRRPGEVPGNEEHRLGFRADKETYSFIKRYAKMIGSKDARGGGKGYSDVIRHALEVLRRQESPLTESEAWVLEAFRNDPELGRRLLDLAAAMDEDARVKELLHLFLDVLRSRRQGPASRAKLNGS